MATKQTLYDQIRKASLLRKINVPDFKTTSDAEMLKFWTKNVNNKQTFYAAVKKRFEKRGLPVPPYRKSTKEQLLKLLKDTTRPRAVVAPVRRLNAFEELKMEKDEKDEKRPRFDQKRLEADRAFIPTPDRKLMRSVQVDLWRILPKQIIKKLDNTGDYKIIDIYDNIKIDLVK